MLVFCSLCLCWFVLSTLISDYYAVEIYIVVFGLVV